MFQQRQRSRRIGGEIGVGENAAVVAFSCSSKRTISATASALLIDTLQFVEAPSDRRGLQPDLVVGIEVSSTALNVAGAKTEGSGWRRSIVRAKPVV